MVTSCLRQRDIRSATDGFHDHDHDQDLDHSHNHRTRVRHDQGQKSSSNLAAAADGQQVAPTDSCRSPGPRSTNAAAVGQKRLSNPAEEAAGGTTLEVAVAASNTGDQS
jgi:hypothetical protein